MTSYSAFQRRLQAGQIVVTGELAPPKGAARATLERLALGMRDAVDAINLTDNQRGVGRMSALGAGVVMRQLGIARDPTSLGGRIAILLNHPVTSVAAGLRGAFRR